MSIKNRLKRLEKKLKDIAPNGMSKAELKRYISETSTAVEMYLRATTKEEEELADELQKKIDAKYKVVPSDDDYQLSKKTLELIGDIENE